jgi:hypothetical protein
MLILFLILGTKHTVEDISPLLMMGIIIITIILSIIFFSEVRTLFIISPKNKNYLNIPECSKKYIGLYLIFQLFISIIIVTSYNFNEINPEIYLAFVFFIFIVILIV